MRASKLINGIDLDTKDKEYNPAEVLIELDEFDISDLSDFKKLSDLYIALVCQTKAKDILDKLCKLCVRNKST